MTVSTSSTYYLKRYMVYHVHRNIEGELPPILAFHEMGKNSTYTPSTSKPITTISTRVGGCMNRVSILLNTKVKKKCKSLSKWKDIDIREVDNGYGLGLPQQTN